ncbi:MAG: ribosomal subunit interface protein [Rhodobacteraceae bacterium]|nr:ribosomal subunit interface protein [Paracoccaceae bacterium]
MQIQVNTDNDVEGGDAMARKVKTEVEAALARFSSQLSRVEVHLGDVNAGRSGSADKRCSMEARPAGQQPIAVTHQAASLEEVFAGALKKLERLLESRFGRLQNHKGATSIRDNDMR